MVKIPSSWPQTYGVAASSLRLIHSSNGLMVHTTRWTRQLQILLCLCMTPDSMGTWITAGNLQYSIEACLCRFWCEFFLFCFLFN